MDDSGRSHYDSVVWLWQAGLRFRGVIDAGCADGQFSLFMSELGPARGAQILNVDAQEDYASSLKAIQDALGGKFAICAVGEQDGGTIELQRAEHAYWASVRPPQDRYWASVNDMRKGAVRVPQRSIDSLVAEAGLPGPYLLKLDVQGAEAAALAGASRTLAQTDAVVVEMLVHDFADIHAALTRAGFVLFDIAHLSYAHSGALGWFYTIYISARHAGLRPLKMWDAQMNGEALAMQAQRRDSIRSEMADALKRYRAGQWPAVSD